MTEPKRLPLVIEPGNRDETSVRDSKLINGYLEVNEESKEVHLYNRPGLTWAYTPAASAAGRGVYNWNGVLYAIVGSSLYQFDGVSTWTAKGTVDTTGGVYTFDTTKGATPRLVLNNGVKAYYYSDAGGFSQITDPDFPTTGLCKGSPYLDGTTYVMTTAAAIQGSGLNDPTSWAADNSIQAYIESDLGVRLAKQLVYIVALKTNSVEVFYDAGNSTGSPLGRVPGQKVSWGCRSGDSVHTLEGDLFWLSRTTSGSVGAMMMSNVKAEPISTSSVERLLQVADYTTVYSWAVRVDGHKFYGVTLKNSNLTLVYDATSQHWAQWTDSNGNYLPIVDSTVGLDNQPLVQMEGTGQLFKVDTTRAYDTLDNAGTVGLIPVDIITPNFDAGTTRGKYLNRLEVVGDQTPGSVLQMRFNDNDYAPDSWSPFFTLDMAQKRPQLDSLGTFSRRAFHFRHVQAAPLRLSAVELNLLQCSL